MIEPGDSGIEREVLAGFLETLTRLDGLGVFPERFTLEIRRPDDSYFMHVSRRRGVIRPVVAEDSRKSVVSVGRGDFVRLIEEGSIAGWNSALEEGLIEIA